MRECPKCGHWQRRRQHLFRSFVLARYLMTARNTIWTKAEDSVTFVVFMTKS